MISHKAVRSILLVIVAVTGLRIATAEETASELYGRGVHAYFAHDFDGAIAQLDEAIAKNNADPRAYYFRALALASKNGIESALDGFAEAANVEFNPRDERLYDVNGALQRVQGSLRLALERERASVRSALTELRKRQNKVRYEKLQRREEVVLFHPDRSADQIEMELPDVVVGKDDPFVTGEAFTGGKAVAVAAPPTTNQQNSAAAGTTGNGSPARDPFAQPESATSDPFDDLFPEQKAAPVKKEEASDVMNPFGEEAVKVAPDNPIFDQSVRPKVVPGAMSGSSIMDMLGRTLSGQPNQTEDRDPFGDAPGPAEKPAEERPAAEAEPKQPPKPIDNPFD